MTGTLVVGVDPGLTTGLFSVVALDKLTGPIAVQIHGHQGVKPFVHALLQRQPSVADGSPLLAVEQFVVGARAARSRYPHAGQVTRDLIGALQELGLSEGADVVLRPAAAVKPWATDRRLEAAGLLASCAGMGHARDAARHALFAAVHAGLTRDPLSSKAVAR